MVNRIINKLFNKLRPSVSQKYLDWAELMPERWEAKKHLQTIHEFGQKDSERVFEQTRPPKDAELAFNLIRLCEMFQVEEIEYIKASLQKLFPNIEEPLNRKQLREIEYIVESTSSGWMRIGTIERQAIKLMPLLIRRIAPELPSEVSYIELSVQKILPSTFIINFDVHLAKIAITNIGQLQEKRYKPKTQFFHLALWKLARTGNTSLNPRLVMRREILDYIENLRVEVEGFLKPYFNGYFFSSSTNNISVLPAIEVFNVKGVPLNDVSFRQWMHDARFWYESLGFDFLLGAYGNNNHILEFPDRNRMRETKVPTKGIRVAVFEEAFLYDVDLTTFGGSREHYITYQLTSLLTDSMPILVMNEFFQVSEVSVRSYRKQAFNKLKSPIYFLISLIKFNEEIYKKEMLFRSIAQEFDNEKQWFNSRSNEILQLKRWWVKDEVQGNDTLKSDLLTQITLRSSRLQQQIHNITKLYSDHILLRNMQVILSFQLLTFAIAVAAVIVAIVMSHDCSPSE